MHTLYDGPIIHSVNSGNIRQTFANLAFNNLLIIWYFDNSYKTPSKFTHCEFEIRIAFLKPSIFVRKPFFN
jgi:hypothetical protein